MDVDQQEEDDTSLSRPDKNALGAALSAIRRNAEAAAFRMVLNSAMDTTATPVVVLGDLNDAQLAVPLEIISGARKYRLFASSGAGTRSSKGLYAAATLQEYRSLRDVYYTHIHEGVRESLDHVLVSQHFYDYATAAVWTFREMRVFNDHLEDEDEDKSVSDHAIVKVVFDLK